MKRQPKCNYCSKVFDGTPTRDCWYSNTEHCQEAGEKYFEIQKIKASKINTHNHNVNKNVKINKTKRYK